MKILLIMFFVSTTILSFVASVGQMLVKKRRLENYNLGALFLLLALLQAQSALILSDTIFLYPSLFFLHITTLYLLGVILYLAYFLVSLKEPLSRKISHIFIPSCVALMMDLLYLFLPAEEKSLLLSNLFAGTAYEYSFYVKLLVAGAALQMVAFMVSLMLRLIIKLRKRGEVHLPVITMVYIVFSSVTIILLAAGYLLSSIDMFMASSIFIGLLIIGAFLVSYRNPEFFHIVLMNAVKKNYVRSQLAGIDPNELYGRLMDLMDKEKIYAEEDISLVDLADELSLTPHQLSEFLNERMGINFYSFINRYRIKEAEDMLLAEPDRTILSITHAVGFNSKSSFYDAFSKFTGMTPNEYRKKYLPTK